MPVDTGIAERFAARFVGLERSHGVYLAPGPAKPGEKREGKRWTDKKNPVTPQLYVTHLEGSAGLGIVPIRDDSTCLWGCGDVDDYRVDHKELVGKIEEFGLPLILCRSKSGGAHCLLFASEPTPAALMRSKLTEWMTALGFPNIEIFPKQDQLDGDDDERGAGSWLNLPYFGADRSTRCALDPETQTSLTVEQFLNLADQRAISVQQLATWEDMPEPEEAEDTSSDDLFPGGPPCLNTLCANGCRSFRNEVLFNITQYYKKVDPSTAQEKALEASRKFLTPPLSLPESTMAIKSGLKGNYNYRCSNAPLNQACDKPTCQKRDYGVGGGKGKGGSNKPRGGTGQIEYGRLQLHNTEPPMWRWYVNDIPLDFTVQELANQHTFLLRVLDVTKIYATAMRTQAWDIFLANACRNAESIVVPQGAKRSGTAMYLLRQFCTSRVTARAKEELLLGRPWLSNGRHYFRPNDFSTFCQAQKFVYTERELYQWLEKQLKEETIVIKGVPTSIWSVEEFDSQTESYVVPRDESSKNEF